MIDFESIYNKFNSELAGSQKRIEINSALGVFYGISPDGFLRLSFLSSTPPPKMESTKLLNVHQGMESDGVYWTCFDLLQPDAKKVYFTFCANLLESVTNTLSEKEALASLKKRYIVWKSMFRKEIKQSMPREVIQGLFGELYFLKNCLCKRFDITECIASWSGPDATSKDFSIGEEWFEVKTVGANSLTVHISSITQLSSKYEGHLAIVKVEKMSPEFSNGESSIEELFKAILNMIEDETIESLFINKIASFGVDISDENISTKFDVKAMNLYKVGDKFPRIVETDVKYEEICDVSYSLIINALSNFMEE